LILIPQKIGSCFKGRYINIFNDPNGAIIGRFLALLKMYQQPLTLPEAITGHQCNRLVSLLSM
jgi:hypothetical protein